MTVNEARHAPALGLAGRAKERGPCTRGAWLWSASLPLLPSSLGVWAPGGRGPRREGVKILAPRPPCPAAWGCASMFGAPPTVCLHVCLQLHS